MIEQIEARIEQATVAIADDMHVGGAHPVATPGVECAAHSSHSMVGSIRVNQPMWSRRYERLPEP